MTDRSRDITITLGDNDKNRVEDTITVSVYSGSVGNATLVDSLSIDIEDKDALPAVAMMVVDKDGDAIEAVEDLTVALMPTGTADAADYTLVGTFTIPSGDDISNPVEIEVRSDEDVGMESLMFDAVVSGHSDNGPGTSTSAAVLSL